MKKLVSLGMLLSLIGTLYINFVAATSGINAQQTGAISDRYPVLFTPAGYVFSIWSLIYLGLLVFTSLALLKPKKVPRGVGEWFIVSNLLNGLWMLAWHFNALTLSVIIMIGLLTALIKINELIFRTKKPVVWLKLPFQLYLGWISVATIANVSVWLYAANWSGWGLSAHFWTMIMTSAAVVLGIVRIKTRNDLVFPLVVAWALWGIRVKQMALPNLAEFMVWLEIILAAALLGGLIKKQKKVGSFR